LRSDTLEVQRNIQELEIYLQALYEQLQEIYKYQVVAEFFSTKHFDKIRY
jgi:hypothetical protein